MSLPSLPCLCPSAVLLALFQLTSETRLLSVFLTCFCVWRQDGETFKYPSYVQDIMGDIFSLGFGPFRCTSRSFLCLSRLVRFDVLRLIMYPLALTRPPYPLLNSYNSFFSFFSFSLSLRGVHVGRPCRPPADRCHCRPRDARTQRPCRAAPAAAVRRQPALDPPRRGAQAGGWFAGPHPIHRPQSAFFLRIVISVLWFFSCRIFPFWLVRCVAFSHFSLLGHVFNLMDRAALRLRRRSTRPWRPVL